jgi:hypothetical protein
MLEDSPPTEMMRKDEQIYRYVYGSASNNGIEVSHIQISFHENPSLFPNFPTHSREESNKGS